VKGRGIIYDKINIIVYLHYGTNILRYTGTLQRMVWGELGMYEYSTALCQLGLVVKYGTVLVLALEGTDPEI
jgi:hypothetical protein